MSFELPKSHVTKRSLADGVEEDFRYMSLNGAGEAETAHERYLKSIRPTSMRGANDHYVDPRTHTQGLEDEEFLNRLRRSVNGVTAAQNNARSVTSGLREEPKRMAGVTRLDTGRVLPAGIFEKPAANERSTLAGARESNRMTTEEYHRMTAGFSPVAERTTTAGVWVEQPDTHAAPSKMNGVVTAEEFFAKRTGTNGAVSASRASAPKSLNGVMSGDEFFAKRSSTNGAETKRSSTAGACTLAPYAMSEKARTLEDGHIHLQKSNEVLMNGSEIHEAFRSALNGACIKYCANCKATYQIA